MNCSKKTVFGILLAAVMCLSIVFATLITVSAEGKNTFEVTGVPQGSSPAIVTFTSDFDGYAAKNFHEVNQESAISDYIFINGVSLTEQNSQVKKYSVHQFSNFHYWYPTAGYEFKAGDVIEYKAGMAFADSEKTEAAYDGGVLEGISLAKNIKFVYNGSTWSVPSDNMAISSVDAFTVSEGDEVTPDMLMLSVKTAGIIADSLQSDQENEDNVKNNIFINGVSIGEINSANSVTNLLGDTMNAVRVFINPTSIDLYFHPDTKIDGKELLFDGTATLKITKEFQSPKATSLAQDFEAEYYGYCSYWVTEKSEKVEPQTVAEPVDLSSVALKFESNNIGFNIGFEGAALTQDVNFYNATPQGLIATPAAGRDKASVDKAVSDGTYESLITHVEINGKLLNDWYSEFGEDSWAQSTGIMVHYRAATEEDPAHMEFWLAGTKFEKTADITVTLKSGLVLPTGYYLAEDVKLVRSGDALIPAPEGSLELKADKDTIYVGQTLQIEAVLSESAGTQKITYSVDKTDVASIDDTGMLTALKAGTVVVTAESENGLTATLTVTVLENSVSEISVTQPTKTEYELGTDLDLTGAQIKITYADGSTEEIAVTESMVSGYDKNKVGEQVITVTYGDKTDSFVVTVVSAEEEPEKTGCSSTVSAASLSVGVLAAGLCVTVLIAKRKRS